MRYLQADMPDGRGAASTHTAVHHAIPGRHCASPATAGAVRLPLTSALKKLMVSKACFISRHLLQYNVLHFVS